MDFVFSSFNIGKVILKLKNPVTWKKSKRSYINGTYLNPISLLTIRKVKRDRAEV